MSVEQSIREVLNGSGLPAAPPAQHPADYGLMDGARAATDTADAIHRVVEAAIAEHYRAADNMDSMAKQVRQSADKFAEQLRGFAKGFTGHISDFLTYAQQACDQTAKHSQEFEDRISKLLYPRASHE